MSTEERLFDFQQTDMSMAKRLFVPFSKDTPIEEIIPISSGMSTSNNIVTLAGHSKRYVLRIYPSQNDHCQMEAAAYDYARRIVNVPEVLYVDSTKIIIDNSYLIMEYVEGTTLRAFIASERALPLDLVHTISESLALLHQTEFPAMALLNESMGILKWLAPLEEQYPALLEGHAGRHIRAATRERLQGFLQAEPALIHAISLKHVFSHGDFNFSNIIITPSLQPCFIDFEYCFSAPVYYDIGKFFRSKSPDIQEFLGSDTRSAFAEGYNSASSTPLPPDWYVLSKFADISAMLHLINKPVLPDGWGEDIDDEITRTLDLLPGSL